MPESNDNLASSSQSMTPGASGLGGGLDVQGMAFLRSIEERMGALRAAAEGVEAAKRLAQQQQAEVESQRSEAILQQREAERLLAQVKQAQEELEARVASSQRQQREAEQGITRERRLVEEAKGEVETKASELARQSEALASQQRELEISQRELASVREKLASKEAELAAVRSDLEARESSVRQQMEVLNQQRLQVEAVLAQTHKQQQELEAMGAATSASAAAEMAKLQRKLATMQEIIDHAGEDARVAEARYEQLQRQMREQEQRFAALQQASDASAAQREQMIAAHGQQVEALQKQLAVSGEEVTQLRARVEQAEQEAAGLRERLNRAIEALQEAAKEDQARVQREAQVTHAAAISTEATSSDVAQLEASIQRLEAELSQQQAAMHETASRLLKSEELLVQKDSELIRLRTEMASSAQNAASDILHGAAERSGEEKSFNVVRRTRLRKLRLLMRGEYEKLVLAKDAIVRQRQMLEEQSARALVYGRATEPTFDGSSMNSGGEPVMPAMGVRGKSATAASMVVLVALVSMTVIGLLTYAIGSTLAPSTYAARVVLAADSQGKAMTPEQMRKFNQGHATLAGDVQVIALAADRFAQRGMSEWADAATLAERLGKQLSVLTEVPGQVTLELRAQGRQQTLRAMETFNSSLVAVANSLGASRGDGAMTVVKQQPIVSEDAVGGPEQTVMMMSAGFGVLAAWAGGIAAFFGIRKGLDRSIKQAMSKPKSKPVQSEFEIFSKKAA